MKPGFGERFGNLEYPIVDSHIHCGVVNQDLGFERIKPLLESAGIGMACLFPPVEDVYDRHDPGFTDSEDWVKTRKRAHDYLVGVAAQNHGIYPYYFVWNDFDTKGLTSDFYGIKWHHHALEPEYRYDDPKCEEMISLICQRGLPVVLEETFSTTLKFLARVNKRTVVIIPHLGMLNGGYERLVEAEVWEDENVYADTALAGPAEIMDFVKRYGSGRLLFGSDFPFGDPGSQLEMVRRLGFSLGDLEKICGGNILGLLGKSPKIPGVKDES